MPWAVPGMTLLEAMEDRAVLCVPWDSLCFMQTLNSYRLLLNVGFVLLGYAVVPSDKTQRTGALLCAPSGQIPVSRKSKLLSLPFLWRPRVGGRQSAFLRIMLLELKNLNINLVSHAMT